MKRFGIISYNIRCNFTNYGSALQSWALKESIKKLGHDAVLIDYCPVVHIDSNPLNPFKNMWDKDDESRKMCEASMPAIEKNYYKFENFYTNQFTRTKKMYNYKNFNDLDKDENLDGYVCGADTIFCVDEFGIDDAFYANYDFMKNGYTVSYAASFGDLHVNDDQLKMMDDRFKNFKALGIRESGMISHIRSVVNVPVEKVLDPTLLLEESDYDEIVADRVCEDKYILLYSRRHNQKMIDYADKLSKKMNIKIIDISLRVNPDHDMYYEAGVEEFLNLVKNAEYVITNSFHGMIFSVQFRKPFVVFSREQCDTKISELLQLFGLEDHMLVTGDESFSDNIDYNLVHERINEARKKSLDFLKMEVDNCK